MGLDLGHRVRELTPIPSWRLTHSLLWRFLGPQVPHLLFEIETNCPCLPLDQSDLPTQSYESALGAHHILLSWQMAARTIPLISLVQCLLCNIWGPHQLPFLPRGLRVAPDSLAWWCLAISNPFFHGPSLHLKLSYQHLVLPICFCFFSLPKDRGKQVNLGRLSTW